MLHRVGRQAAARSSALRSSAAGHAARRSAARQTAARALASASGEKLVSPPMTYISGEEMTHHCMNLIMESWIEPHIDTSAWETFDLSCVSRDNTEDQVLHDAVESGARIGAIFKEPTVTPTEVQKEKLGLKKSWGSPNGAMRRGWNCITISRDTIHIDGMELGFKHPVLFERHAVGGEYAAGWKPVGPGKLMTIFAPDDPDKKIETVDERHLDNEVRALPLFLPSAPQPHSPFSARCGAQESVVVTYDNPLDNVTDLAHHFFSRCLKAEVVPYVVTKKTVFKWQEGFWVRMKEVFDEHYRQDYLDAGLLDGCGEGPLLAVARVSTRLLSPVLAVRTCRGRAAASHL